MYTFINFLFSYKLSRASPGTDDNSLDSSLLEHLFSEPICTECILLTSSLAFYIWSHFFLPGSHVIFVLALLSFCWYIPWSNFLRKNKKKFPKYLHIWKYLYSPIIFGYFNLFKIISSGLSHVLFAPPDMCMLLIFNGFSVSLFLVSPSCFLLDFILSFNIYGEFLIAIYF